MAKRGRKVIRNIKYKVGQSEEGIDLLLPGELPGRRLTEQEILSRIQTSDEAIRLRILWAWITLTSGLILRISIEEKEYKRKYLHIRKEFEFGKLEKLIYSIQHELPESDELIRFVHDQNLGQTKVKILSETIEAILNVIKNPFHALVEFYSGIFEIHPIKKALDEKLLLELVKSEFKDKWNGKFTKNGEIYLPPVVIGRINQKFRNALSNRNRSPFRGRIRNYAINLYKKI